MELVYTNTVDDLVALQLYFFDHDRALRRQQVLLSMVPVVLVMVLLVLLSLKEGPSGLTWLGMGVAVVLALVMRRFTRQRLERSARLAFARGRGQRTLGEHRLSLSDEGIVERTANGDYTTPWSAITTVAETGTAVYILCGRSAGMVIPRQRLSQGNLQAFAAAVSERLPSARAR